MKMSVSPLLAIGLVLFVIYAVIDRTIVEVPSPVAIPMLVVGVVLIVLGGLRIIPNAQ